MGGLRLAGLLRRVSVYGAGVLCGTLGVFGVVLALGCAPASAALQYPFVGELSGIEESSSVAVDDKSGDVLVPARSPAGSGRVVDVFDAAGVSLSPWTGSNTPAGAFGEGRMSVAVDDASGRVYVAVSSSGAVDVFEASGSYVCQITGAGSASVSSSECDAGAAGRPSGAFIKGGESLVGVAVDQATGEVYVSAEGGGGHELDRFSAAGVYESRITGTPSGPFRDVRGFAVDDVSGELLAAENETQVVDVFDAATGSYVTAWDGSAASNPPGAPGAPASFEPNGGVAVDEATGDVYVGDALHGVVDEFGPSGEYVDQLTGFADGLRFRSVQATAVDQATGRLYLALEHTFEGGNHAREFEEFVDIFGDEPLVVPDVRTGGASAVKAESAVLEGDVNPDGVQVSACRFEYGTSTSYGQSVPCAGSVGAGSSEVAVRGEATGLAPDTTYHYRLVASNANGTNFGTDREAHTLAVPVIDSLSSANLTGDSVDLDARINPRGVATLDSTGPRNTLIVEVFYGQAGWVDAGVDWQGAVEVSGGAVVAAGRGAAVLA